MKKKRPALLVFPGLVFLLLAFMPAAFAADQPADFSVGRMVLSAAVVANEPVRSAEVFAASTGTVYCFLEATDIVRHTEVSFVWYYNDTEKARVTLPLHQGPRWRTYSSKKLAGLQGRWRVEVLDTTDKVVHSVSFLVK